MLSLELNLAKRGQERAYGSLHYCFIHSKSERVCHLSLIRDALLSQNSCCGLLLSSSHLEKRALLLSFCCQNSALDLIVQALILSGLMASETQFADRSYDGLVELFVTKTGRARGTSR